MKNTKIEWATHTFNAWWGCTPVSRACDHCYAEAMAKRFKSVGWGDESPRVRTSSENWKQPLRWDREARNAGRVDTVFSLSMGDIWDKKVDDVWRGDFFDLIERTPNLLYLLLSKRIVNSLKMCSPHMGRQTTSNPVLPRNTALGATVVTQQEWDREVPRLIEAARVLGPRFNFVSVEPMLGPIIMIGELPDWVICGGESGPSARPIYPGWVTSLRDQCAQHRVPFFFKQWGAWAIAEDGIACDERYFTWVERDGTMRQPHEKASLDSWAMKKVGKSVAGNHLFGQQHLERPAEISA